MTYRFLLLTLFVCLSSIAVEGSAQSETDQSIVERLDALGAPSLLVPPDNSVALVPTAGGLRIFVTTSSICDEDRQKECKCSSVVRCCTPNQECRCASPSQPVCE